MVATTLDYLTMGLCWFLLGALLLAIFLLKKRPTHNPWQDVVRAVFVVFIVFVLTLFVNILYLYIPHTSQVGLITSERFGDIPAPDIYVLYPTSTRAGETVEIVLGAINVNLPTDIDMYLEDAETGEKIGEALMTVKEGENEARNFKYTMPKRDLRILVKAMHQDTLSELRTTVTVERAGLDIALIMLIGVLAASPVLALAIKKI